MLNLSHSGKREQPPRWRTPSRGRLTWREQLREARSLIAGNVIGIPHSIKAVIADRLPRRAQPLPRLVPPPDTAICDSAGLIAAAAYSYSLQCHVHRCWHWATLIASNEGINFDAETLYCAALLHDIGLTPAGVRGMACECFAINGARAAAGMLKDRGAPDHTVGGVAEAIARHFDARLPADASNEVTLLHDAAYLDVVGSGVHRTSVAQRRAVLAAHPRTGFAAEFAAALKREAEQRPRSRAALSHRLGASVAMRLNPLEHHLT